MKGKKVRKKVLAAADTMLGTAVDAALFVLYLGLTVCTVRTMSEAIATSEEVEALRDRFNYKAIKQAIYVLTRKQLIRRSHERSALNVTITDLGKKRLQTIIPSYLTARPWDGFVYLVSYDIPAKQNHQRDRLRDHIKATGGALLQESLWINPYNPSLLLEEFATRHNIPGAILVSKLGRDGAIGEENLTDVIARVYELDKLADRYSEFIERFEENQKIKPVALIHDYLNILKDDSQLPFALLPKDFPADRAYRLAKPYLDKLTVPN